MVTEIVIMNFLDMGMTNSIQFLIQNDIPWTDRGGFWRSVN